MTAEQLVEQLKADPDYQAGIKAQAERAGQVRASEEGLLRALALHGYPADSLGELVERSAPLSGDLSAALLECLATATEPVLQETLVRALGASGAPFDVQPLVRLFEQTSSDSVRWATANTLAELRPLSIRVWLIAALQTPKYGKAREMLALAVARTSPPDQANPVLVRLLDDMPGHAALALAESGTVEELRLLQSRAVSAKGWAKKEIGRAIRAISQRM